MTTQRLRLEWINASEGELFASTVKEMEKVVNRIGREEIEKSKELFRQGRSKESVSA